MEMGQNLRGNRNCQENGERFLATVNESKILALQKEGIAHEKEM